MDSSPGSRWLRRVRGRDVRTPASQRLRDRRWAIDPVMEIHPSEVCAAPGVMNGAVPAASHWIDEEQESVST